VKTDYDRIAKAIHYISNHVGKQPSLDDIATHVHLSPYHFQRLFSRWAGVTPKRFLQVLTLEKAKRLLTEHNMSVFDASDAVGLSSGSRLYDHFVHIEAVTPSEYKQAGLGLTIYYGIHSTPFGDAFIAVTARGVCKLLFMDEQTKSELLNHVKQAWPRADFFEDQQKTAMIIESIFHQDPSSTRPLSLLVRGTNFQIKVWQALLNIRPGQLTSYSHIAKAIGKPGAARAVGSAVGANPVAFVIPCHRVLRQSGNLGGYRWGLTRKQAILAWEAAKND